jgi:hypothetical protein
LTLGKVMYELAKGGTGGHLPFRDSLLTRLLKVRAVFRPRALGVLWLHDGVECVGSWGDVDCRLISQQGDARGVCGMPASTWVLGRV